MVECAALEMRFTGNRNVGSNPTLSASLSLFQVTECVPPYVGLRRSQPLRNGSEPRPWIFRETAGGSVSTDGLYDFPLARPDRFDAGGATLITTAGRGAAPFGRSRRWGTVPFAAIPR